MCIPNHSQYCISLKISQQQHVRAQLQKVNDSSDVNVPRDRQLIIFEFYAGFYSLAV